MREIAVWGVVGETGFLQFSITPCFLCLPHETFRRKQITQTFSKTYFRVNAGKYLVDKDQIIYSQLQEPLPNILLLH